MKSRQLERNPKRLHLSTSVRKKVKKYFKALDAVEDRMRVDVMTLEADMQMETGIKDLEFVWVDGCIVGIGTPMRKKKLPLIHRS
jgi:hypothetical protein